MRDPGRTSSPVPRAQSRQRHRCGQLRTRSCRQAGRRRCLPAAGWGKAASGSRCPLRTRRCNTRLPSPMRSPQKSMGALSFSPSPMTTTPSKEMEPSTCARARARASSQQRHVRRVSIACSSVARAGARAFRIASTAAPSAASLSPLPSQCAAASAAASVTRTCNRAAPGGHPRSTCALPRAQFTACAHQLECDVAVHGGVVGARRRRFGACGRLAATRRRRKSRADYSGTLRTARAAAPRRRARAAAGRQAQQHGVGGRARKTPGRGAGGAPAACCLAPRLLTWQKHSDAVTVRRQHGGRPCVRVLRRVLAVYLPPFLPPADAAVLAPLAAGLPAGAASATLA